MSSEFRRREVYRRHWSLGDYRHCFTWFDLRAPRYQQKTGALLLRSNNTTASRWSPGGLGVCSFGVPGLPCGGAGNGRASACEQQREKATGFWCHTRRAGLYIGRTARGDASRRPRRWQRSPAPRPTREDLAPTTAERRLIFSLTA